VKCDNGEFYENDYNRKVACRHNPMMRQDEMIVRPKFGLILPSNNVWLSDNLAR